MLVLFVYIQCGVQHVLTLRVAWRVSYKRQELLTFREHLVSPRFKVGSVLLISLVFCVVYVCASFSERKMHILSRPFGFIAPKDFIWLFKSFNFKCTR